MSESTAVIMWKKIFSAYVKDGSIYTKLADDVWWRAIMLPPFISTPPPFFSCDEQQQTFMESFSDAESMHNREKAALGLLHVNRPQANELLCLLRDCEELSDNSGHDNDSQLSDMNQLLMFANHKLIALLIKKGIDGQEPKLFQDMADLIKENGLTDGYNVKMDAGKMKGGPYSDGGIVWRVFCDYLAREVRMPTKKEISDLSNVENIRKQFKKLGLSGLPRSK